MHESKNIDDIIKSAEILQRSYVIETTNEQNAIRKKPEKGETRRISLTMFKNGNSISAIAKERNLAYTTIEGHLADFIATGEIDISEIVDQIRLDKILDVIEENPTLTSSELKKQLGDDFSYGQIKAAINYRTYLAEKNS